MTEQGQLDLLRLSSRLAYWAFKAILYFASFLAPALTLYRFRSSSPVFLLALTLGGYWVAGLTFLLLLIVVKKYLIGSLDFAGLYTIHARGVKKWFCAAALVSIARESPFRSFTVSLSPIANWYYRGMGAKMPSSVSFGREVMIVDPYFLEVGENATFGGSCTIQGHLGRGPEIRLGRVVIGAGAVIGLRAIILPDVKVGRNSVVAAGAVVVSGTVIPDGEAWGGIPARKLASRA